MDWNLHKCKKISQVLHLYNKEVVALELNLTQLNNKIHKMQLNNLKELHQVSKEEMKLINLQISSLAHFQHKD